MRGRACCLVVLLGVALGCAGGGKRAVGESSPAVAEPAALSSQDAAARLRARLAPRLSRASANLTVVTRPDGRRSLRTNGSFSQAQLARIGADGKLTTACVDSMAGAERVLAEAESSVP